MVSSSRYRRFMVEKIHRIHIVHDTNSEIILFFHEVNTRSYS